MLYHKFSIGNNRTAKVDLYEDEIFTDCPRCGDEQQVSPELLISILSDGDFSGTSVFCSKCSKKVTF